MKVTTPSLKQAAALMLAAAVALAAAYQFIDHERHMSQALPLPELKTVCIGRLLIDLPVDMEIKGDVELFYGLTKDFETAEVWTVKQNASKADFDRIVRQRIAELEASYIREAPTKNALAEWRTIDDGTVLIRRNEESMVSRVAEAYVLRGKSIGKITRTIYNNAEFGGRVDDPADIEAKVLRVARGVTPLDDPLKSGKGTCLGGLMINEMHDGEKFSVFARSSQFPDVSFGLYSDSIVSKDDGGMLQRVDRKAPDIARLGIRISDIRRGKTQIASRPAEELLNYGKNSSGKIERQFDAETLLLGPSTFAHPLIHIDMSMGGQHPTTAEYVDPSFAEADSIRLWDAIIKSIRLRPSAI